MLLFFRIFVNELEKHKKEKKLSRQSNEKKKKTLAAKLRKKRKKKPPAGQIGAAGSVQVRDLLRSS